jgi:type II secretory pathway pseudopilin PulG
MTLIEVMLVIAIGAFLTILGFRQYQVYRQDADVQQLKYNIDMIFQGLANFYYANCGWGVNGMTHSPGTPPTPGLLSPTHLPSPKNPYPIQIRQDLVQTGFLNAPLPLSPLIDRGGDSSPYAGYTAQFNRYDTTRTTPAAIGTVVMWQAQVAIKLKNAGQAEQYKLLLQADCRATTPSALCRPTLPLPGPYLIWARMPAFATPSSESTYGLTNQVNKEFTEMYTTYSILNSTNHSKQQYFLCGS